MGGGPLPGGGMSSSMIIRMKRSRAAASILALLLFLSAAAVVFRSIHHADAAEAASAPFEAQQQIVIGAEGLRHERALTFEKSRSKRYKACSAWKARTVSRYAILIRPPNPNRNPAQRIRFGSEGISCPAKKPRRKAGIRAKQEIPELVRLKGLEPTRIAAREPKSRMSTNSITGAYFIFLLFRRLQVGHRPSASATSVYHTCGP